MTDMTSKVHFGIIGCSSIAEKSTIPALIKTKEAKLQMIGSRSLAKAKRFSDKFSCDSYGNYEEVLERSDIDTVYISLPIGLQEKWVIKSAKAGKHILCEKSIITSSKSAKKIISECNKNKVRILEAFAFRFHPQHKRVEKIILQNRLGKLFSFYGKFGFILYPSTNNFRFSQDLGGGALYDVGCYLINSNRMIFQNEPIRVTCKLNFDKSTGVETNGVVLMEYPHNKIGVGIFGYDLSFQSTYEVWGSKGSINVGWAFNIKKNSSAKINLRIQNSLKRFNIKAANQTKLMLENFCKTLKNSHNAEYNFENEILSQAKVMDAARESNARRKTINLSW